MNYYDILGISKNATQDEIKDAYKTLIKRYHPDVYPGDKTYAEKRTTEINIAYETLSNINLKSEYDEKINPTNPYNTTNSTSSYNNYTYTPPKYDTSSSKYSYDNYKKNNTQQSYSYYDYRRYSDFHRSKTPNSNYTTTNNLHDDFSNTIINKFDKMPINKKLQIIFIILTIYIIFIIISFSQFFSIMNKSSSSQNDNSSINSITDTPDYNNNHQNSDFTYPYQTYFKFDINDYFSDDELYPIYKEYFPNEDITFTEFKNIISEYLYTNYFNNH